MLPELVREPSSFGTPLMKATAVLDHFFRNLLVV
jgi:hypothetical protein